MEVANIAAGFFAGKSILITGSTGFLAKLLVEKILRIQPNVKKLYLLMRSNDTESAMRRLQDEVIGSEVFKVMRQNWGESLASLISERVFPVCGDISLPDFGIKDFNLAMEMHTCIDIIINSAGVTKFDERYDVSLGINTLGALHLLNFANRCVNLTVLLHVSTAYVCGEPEGAIEEKEIGWGETPNGAIGLDFEAEKMLVEDKLNCMKSEGATNEVIRASMKDLGLHRAKMFGWPNTYSFTKAMGEMILANKKASVPVVVIRPTIITSTYKEPFSGWIQGCRTIDSLIVVYGKRQLPRFIGDPKSILDFMPGDMVVNSMIVAMVAKATKTCDIIYHISSSMRNPMIFNKVSDMIFDHFTKNPCRDKNGVLVKVGKPKYFRTMDQFQAYMMVNYFFAKDVYVSRAKCFLQAISFVNLIFFGKFQDRSTKITRKIKYLRRLGEIYRPYVYFKGIFDDRNAERLRVEARQGIDEEVFFFDPMCINWEDYFKKTHLPGVERYLLK